MSERVKIILDKNADILRLPAIALRGLVVFPGNIIHFEVGRKKSIAAIEWAMSNNLSLIHISDDNRVRCRVSRHGSGGLRVCDGR